MAAYTLGAYRGLEQESEPEYVEGMRTLSLAQGQARERLYIQREHMHGSAPAELEPRHFQTWLHSRV